MGTGEGFSRGDGSPAVVLVHGLAAHRWVMVLLARSLRKDFGRVINWGYRSIWSPIQRHGEDLAGLLRRLDGDESVTEIHLVTHSMGGIVTRLALELYRPSKLGRLVMIAPPNSGSAVATFLSRWFGGICPPLCQLTDRDASFVCSLPHPEEIELGVIAARGDYIVREASTHLPCERDHVVLPGLHSSVLFRRETAEQVKTFLLVGKFYRATKSIPVVAPR
jgi:pimeloyl-ACP methyl ester carboxylesterase